MTKRVDDALMVELLRLRAENAKLNGPSHKKAMAQRVQDLANELGVTVPQLYGFWIHHRPKEDEAEAAE